MMDEETLGYCQLPSAADGEACCMVLSDEHSEASVHEALPIDASPRPAQMLRRMREAVFDWWTAITSTGFRCSGFSRRKYWHLSLPAFFTALIMIDITDDMQNYLWLYDTLAAIAVLAATRNLSRSTESVDGVVCIAITACYIVQYIELYSGIPFWGSISLRGHGGVLDAYTVAFSLAFVHLCGVHSYMIGATSLLPITVTLVLEPSEVIGLIVVFGVLCAFCVWQEHQSATAYRTHVGLQKLLDDGCDGFCSIELRSGRICNPSTKMKELFGEDACTGSFSDILEPRDAPKVAEFICAGANDDFQVVLVSFRVGTSCRKTFDCKLTSYLKSWNRLDVCLQVVGEVRMENPPHSSAGEVRDGAVAVNEIHHVAIEDRDHEVSIVFSDDGMEDKDCAQTKHQLCSSKSAAAYSVYDSEALLTVTSSFLTVRNCERHDAATQTPTITMASSSTQAAEGTVSPRPPRLPSGDESTRLCEKIGKALPRKRSTQRWYAKNIANRVMLCSTKLALPQFDETPRKSMQFLAVSTLEHINARGTGCCGFHVAATRLFLTLKEMLEGTENFPKHKCIPEFSPHRGWQCADCRCMNVLDEASDDEEGLEDLPLCALCSGTDRLVPRQIDSGVDGDDSSMNSVDSSLGSDQK